MSTMAARGMRLPYPLIGRGDPARDNGLDPLQVARGPALEGRRRVWLVRRHHRVAVVPVQARLGVEPEGSAGAIGDAAEGVGVGLAAVRSGVAEDDERRARVEVVADQLSELEPDAAVVGIAGDVGHTALLADLLGDRAEVALALEHLRHLGD